VAFSPCGRRCSHASNLTHPVQVNDPLLEFLRSLPNEVNP
jgi:hypothetical protein